MNSNVTSWWTLFKDVQSIMSNKCKEKGHVTDSNVWTLRKFHAGNQKRRCWSFHEKNKMWKARKKGLSKEAKTWKGIALNDILLNYGYLHLCVYFFLGLHIDTDTDLWILSVEGENEHGRIFIHGMMTHESTPGRWASGFIGFALWRAAIHGFTVPSWNALTSLIKHQTSKQHSFPPCLRMFRIASYGFADDFLGAIVFRARYAKSASRRVESERARREEICSYLAASCIYGKLSILFWHSLATQFWMHSGSTVKAKCHAVGSSFPEPVQGLRSLMEQHARLIEQNPCY